MLRNGPDGYGRLTKVLHWATVLALVAQFAVGYSLDLDDACDPQGEELSGGDTTDAFEERLDRIEDQCEARADGYDVFDDGLLTLHVLLGVLIIVLALVRLAWRRLDGLPPWAASLSPGQRTVATWTERCLLGLLIVIPATGLVLVFSGEDDLLWLHIAAHVAFFVALAVHVGLTLGKRLLPRML